MDIDSYTTIVNSFYQQLKKIPADYASRTEESKRWTLKQIVGHLIDSASNNHQRFVRLQSGSLKNFPGYDQTRWVENQRYNDLAWSHLVELWYQFNVLLLHIIDSLPAPVPTNVWVFNNEERSLEFLIEDYFAHLQIHILQVEKTLGDLGG